MKRTFVIILICAVVLALVFVCFKSYFKSENNPGNFTIGGQRDANGCLVPAGYSYNSSLGFCVREWEIDSEKRKAIQTAHIKEDLDFGSFTIDTIDKLNCTGCYQVYVTGSGNGDYLVFIENWTIKSNKKVSGRA